MERIQDIPKYIFICNPLFILMKYQMGRYLSCKVAIATCLVTGIIAVHNTFTIEFDDIHSGDIISKIENTVFPLCYMECYEESECKSIGMEKYEASRNGNCYLLKNIPLKQTNPVKKFIRPTAITEKVINLESCGGDLKEGCEGEKDNPAKSCADLIDKNPALESGFYWLKFDKSTRVYCDMKTSGGGWLQIGSIVATPQTNPDDYAGPKVKSSNISRLSEVQTNKFLLSNLGMKKLRKYVDFSQFRFYCTKYYHKRVIHLMTTKDDLGSKVVDFLALLSNENPSACNSYSKLKDDTSLLLNKCSEWGSGKTGKWSYSGISDDSRNYNHLLFVAGQLHVNVVEKRMECDDDKRIGSGYNNHGIWKYFVR